MRDMQSNNPGHLSEGERCLCVFQTAFRHGEQQPRNTMIKGGFKFGHGTHLSLPNEGRATRHLQEAEVCSQLAWHYAGAYLQVVLTSMEWNPREGKTLKFSHCVGNG